ncbi:MAG: PilN domain-containing protein [Phycisphaerales bacterium]|nr:PilN domain-containing protein [Phycisphaerales bacterium]
MDFRPDWYVASLAERAGARLHVSGLIAVACLLVVWWADATARSRADTVAVAKLATALEAQDPMVAQMNRLDQEVSRRQSDLALWHNLDGGLPVAALLAEISHLAPPSLTLRAMVLDRPPRMAPQVTVASKAAGKPVEKTPPAPTESVLELTGWAASGQDIANFVSGMSASPLFAEVTLGYERSETVAQRVVVAFKIVCVMPEFE